MPCADLSGEQQAVFQKVIRLARSRGIPFAAGGFFGTAAYTGHCRESKDLDLYTLPRDRDAMVEVLTSAGLSDYYPQAAYDRRWIYRASCGAVLVDVIWAMANLRAEVDLAWLDRGREIELAGERLRALPAEELLWSRLYVLQKDRCDWPDILNLLAAHGAAMDWNRLIARVGPDLPLLSAAVQVFGWVDPDAASRLPEGLRGRLGISSPAPGPPRPELLDRRDWYRC